VGRGRLSAAAGLGRDSLRLLNAAFSNRSLIEIKLFRDSAHHLRRLAFRVTHVVKIIEHLTGLRRHCGWIDAERDLEPLAVLFGLSTGGVVDVLIKTTPAKNKMGHGVICRGPLFHPHQCFSK